MDLLMLIFSISIFIVGLYIYKFEDIKFMSFKATYKNLTKREIKNIGKYTMIVSIIPLIVSIIIFIF